VTTTVLNHSYSDRRVRLAVRVQVGYRTDLAEAFRVLLDVAHKHPRVLKDPEPTTQVLQLADSGVDLELGFWIEDPERGSQSVRSDLSVALLTEFNARGIEIPYPQREVRLLGAAPDHN
jgi:small-conductance mechanosensitive channel